MIDINIAFYHKNCSRGDIIKISAKSQYAIAAMIYMANKNDSLLTLVNISKDLNISKLYLEQIFSLLKKGNLVSSVKGPQGGYRLNKNPEEITILDILSITENNLFNNDTYITLAKCPEVSKVISNHVINFIDEILKEALIKVTLKQLIYNSTNYVNNSSFIYYI